MVYQGGVEDSACIRLEKRIVVYPADKRTLRRIRLKNRTLGCFNWGRGQCGVSEYRRKDPCGVKGWSRGLRVERRSTVCGGAHKGGEAVLIVSVLEYARR